MDPRCCQECGLLLGTNLCTPLSLYSPSSLCAWYNVCGNINLHHLYVLDCNVYSLLWLYISSIVSLLLCLCIRLYSAHPNMQDLWVSGMHYVSMVFRYYISADALYMAGSGVVRRCDRPIDSSIVPSPYIEQVGPMSKWLCGLCFQTSCR